MLIVNIFDQLIAADSEGNHYPGLAKSWEVSGDGLEYTFNNSYPLAARQLTDNSALFISNRNSALSAIPSLDYNYEKNVEFTPFGSVSSVSYPKS